MIERQAHTREPPHFGKRFRPVARPDMQRSMGASPYESMESRSFWRTGVAQQQLPAIADLYRPKFAISPDAQIATAGSCFAQHIARYLRRYGYNVIDGEPPPPGMSSASAKKFGFGVYSARYSNIYVVRQLLQLLQEAAGGAAPVDWIWERDGRWFDGLRPSVEPDGLGSPEEVMAHRAQHLGAVRRVFRRADLLIFTLGLTEAWVHRQSGTVYPTAPGTIAGKYNPEVHGFKNFGYIEIYRDFLHVRERLKKKNPAMKFLLTVSPVPLTATASRDHVLAATMYSKSVLRAVAGALSSEFDDVDYFPSYEIVVGHQAKGAFFDANLRSVSEIGVQTVMTNFFSAHGVVQSKSSRRDGARKSPDAGPATIAPTDEGVVCEDVLLESFAQ